MAAVDIGILTLDDFDFRGKTVILRLDINSPIEPLTGQLIDDNRIRKSVPSIDELVDARARVVMLAHQGDTEDYHKLASLLPHAERLSELLEHPVDFIDDIAGPAAIDHIKALDPGGLLLLNNVRYLVEEVSTFVRFVKLTPEQLGKTRLVRNLSPLADYYVSEAFAAAHRYTPSLVGFAEVLPAAGGRLFVEELNVLSRVKENPAKPCIYMLGGARIADAFSMMKQVLQEGTADYVLTSGLTGEVILLAKGYQLGEPTETLIHTKGLSPYIAEARELLERYEDRILYPSDFAVIDGERKEITLEDLPIHMLLVDIGERTIERFIEIVHRAKTIFMNGPPGIYEEAHSALGTERLLTAVAEAPGYSVIGGGDSVAAAARFKVREQISYVCTSGGGMVRFLSGQELPVVEALRRSARRYRSGMSAV